MLALGLIGALSVLALSGAGADSSKTDSSDMSKVGPWARMPTNEAQTKKDVSDFVNGQEALEAKGDVATLLAHVDFPVTMVTDDSKGNPSAMVVDEPTYEAMMKPFWQNFPTDMKMTNKLTISVLSDSLANVIDDFSMTTDGHTLSGRNQSIVVKSGGMWKWKVLTEAGWGDMNASPAAAAAPPAPAMQ
jgi:hypothetical protein